MPSTQSQPAPAQPKTERAVVLLVFVALLLDLLAFTIPLPLFPRIVAWYSARSPPTSLLARTLAGLRGARSTLLQVSVAPRSASSSGALASSAAADEAARRWDVVLLGGFLGSVFSFCQYLVSPAIGRLADAHGRRRVLLATMAGNVVSTLLWLQSTSFTSFLLARLVGGLSEGNVQLSILVLSDVTTPATRPRALALIGLAFSLCFTLGPLLGAWFASSPLPGATLLPGGFELNIYALPASIALGLLVLETAYLALALPETRGWVVRGPAAVEQAGNQGAEGVSPPVRRSLGERKRALEELKAVHRTFLFFFSGAEFTLTFLTYDLFGFSNAQSGRLLAFIGVLSSLLQGTYTRRPSVACSPLALSARGVVSTSLGLGLLACLPWVDRATPQAAGLLWGGAACLAFASASVVNGLNAGASLLCADGPGPTTTTKAEGGEGGELVKGKTMGEFRSAGQMGRAAGPIFACTSYWLLGPSACYAITALALGSLARQMRHLVRRERELAAAAAAVEMSSSSGTRTGLSAEGGEEKKDL